MRSLPSLRFSIYMSVVCDKGKGRPLGAVKATFSTALKVLQCSKTIMRGVPPPPPPTAPQTVEHPSGSHTGWPPPPWGGLPKGLGHNLLMQFSGLGSSKMVVPLPSTRCLAEGNIILLKMHAYRRCAHLWLTSDFFPALGIGDPRECRGDVALRLSSSPREGRGEVATSDFVPLCKAVLKEPDFFFLKVRLGTRNPCFVAWPLELGLGTRNPRFVVWPLELGLGTHKPRFVAWPLELGTVTLNPRFVVWPLELGLGTHKPRFVAWPLELELGTLNPRFVAWPLELGLGTLNPRFVAWPLELELGTLKRRFVVWPLELGFR